MRSRGLGNDEMKWDSRVIGNGIPVECGWKNEEVGWEDCEA